ncbi:hypothetical protein [Ktedonospora formicarum]|uniref:Uncharacterized protein n=1 Tax=Ktedonospora formicarum TaxID=2778364 RepID=A0A8J3IDX4_9CHLR|nr:hypothetical protein [Ktedonospora formicarum]GHO51405.1 hypothetical protein KSX_95680 [Ktedonospora formicarum]
MTCNLAVAITKAALIDERLKALLDQHLDQVTLLLARYLQRRHPQLAIDSNQARIGKLTLGEGLVVELAQGTVSITGVSTSRTAQYMEDLSQEASTFLTLVADQLFTQEVEGVLRQVGRLTAKQTSDVEDAGGAQRATIYSLQIANLKVRVFVLPQGKLQIFVDTGTFNQAKTATLVILRDLQAQGLEVQLTSEVEQHRDDVDHVHVRQAHQRGGGPV